MSEISDIIFQMWHSGKNLFSIKGSHNLAWKVLIWREEKRGWGEGKLETESKRGHLKHKSVLYRVSQEECARLWENVPYVKVHRYNPKHLYPKLNGYGDNGERSLKVWQLLHTYWLTNTRWKPFHYQLMHTMLKNTELLKHSKITLQHVSVYAETIFRELQSVLG